MWKPTRLPYGDGRFLALSIDSTLVRLIDLRSGRPIGPPLEHDGRVSEAVFNPAGSLLATGSGRSVRLGSTSSGRSLGPPLKLNGDLVVKPVFAPGGSSFWAFVG